MLFHGGNILRVRRADGEAEPHPPAPVKELQADDALVEAADVSFLLIEGELVPVREPERGFRTAFRHILSFPVFVVRLV